MLPVSAGAFVLFPASKVYSGLQWRRGGFVFFPADLQRWGSGGRRENKAERREFNVKKKGGEKKVGAVKKEVSVPGWDIIYSFNAFIQRAEVVFTLS